MKKIFLITTLFLFTFLFVNLSYADISNGENGEVLGEYTMEEVEERNTPDNCWMVFEDGVYDFSEYIPDHDEYMDIREWCGMDMTEDFRNKAGAGRDHRSTSYEMLEDYYIGVFLDYESVEWPLFTRDEVAEHNTPDDCWMIFENSVYDFSDYIPNHDRFMDIREWCGMDMTQDFRDKAGAGRDHRPGSYQMLPQYKIGEIEADFVLEDPEILILDLEEDEVISAPPREYNILIPFLLTTVLYWGGYFIAKKKGRAIQVFNGFWNTVLLLTLLIPGMAFGIFIIIRTQRPELWDIDFDFMYWHVELSLVMGFVAIYHFIQRFGQYKHQIIKRKSV